MLRRNQTYEKFTKKRTKKLRKTYDSLLAGIRKTYKRIAKELRCFVGLSYAVL